LTALIRNDCFFDKLQPKYLDVECIIFAILGRKEDKSKTNNDSIGDDEDEFGDYSSSGRNNKNSNTNINANQNQNLQSGLVVQSYAQNIRQQVMYVYICTPMLSTKIFLH
jgi:hypothetical protein